VSDGRVVRIARIEDIDAFQYQWCLCGVSGEGYSGKTQHLRKIIDSEYLMRRDSKFPRALHVLGGIVQVHDVIGRAALVLQHMPENLVRRFT
jgi:hypothetical protein